MKRKALGRGLSAILSEKPLENTGNKSVKEIPLEKIRVNHLQPRTLFDDEALSELTESIKRQGVLQPILVRVDPNSSGDYQLIAGERRFRASKLAEKKQIPCIVLEVKEAEMLEIALVENIQRSNLNPVEEAKAYKLLADNYGLKQDEISERVGKSRESVANVLRLLKLPEKVLAFLQDGKISLGHAKCLLSLAIPEKIYSLAEEIVANGISVRQTEELVRSFNDSPKKKSTESTENEKHDTHVSDLQKVLERELQTKVRLKMQGNNKGKIEIHFFNLDQLDELLKRWDVDING